jgi:hypothetical protein
MIAMMMVMSVIVVVLMPVTTRRMAADELVAAMLNGHAANVIETSAIATIRGIPSNVRSPLPHAAAPRLAKPQAN